ncbi:MAG: hypothetical protein A2201_11230 [Alicyclobacillus sp. RIFOXYA1_FULL_53_8]|nr:MAG: hypothetical protein A2201_11230 [Alicyclobacillus sp. RIFOXYA1_FULL_53_8]
MSDHEHEHDHDHEHDFDDEIIVLEDEDGKEHNFVLGEVIQVDGKDYAILLPVDDDLEEGVIFRIEGEEDDQMILAEIDNDEEWEKVVQAYNEQMDDSDDDEE